MMTEKTPSLRVKPKQYRELAEIDCCELKCGQKIPKVFRAKQGRLFW